jgi:hypothetical protein
MELLYICEWFVELLSWWICDISMVINWCIELICICDLIVSMVMVGCVSLSICFVWECLCMCNAMFCIIVCNRIMIVFLTLLLEYACYRIVQISRFREVEASGRVCSSFLCWSRCLLWYVTRESGNVVFIMYVFVNKCCSIFVWILLML